MPVDELCDRRKLFVRRVIERFSSLLNPFFRSVLRVYARAYRRGSSKYSLRCSDTRLAHFFSVRWGWSIFVDLPPSNIFLATFVEKSCTVIFLDRIGFTVNEIVQRLFYQEVSASPVLEKQNCSLKAAPGWKTCGVGGCCVLGELVNVEVCTTHKFVCTIWKC